MLRLSRVEVSYGNIRAVRGVSLEVRDGSIVTLLGANGAGKTTTLRAISGLLPMAAGTIELDGRRIDRLPPEEIVVRGISQVPQGREVFPDMSVLENLEMGAYRRWGRARLREGMERVFRYFPHLAERRGQTAGTLSGGEQQMLAIGRALMARPRLLLLDEPSLGLAPLVVAEIFRIVREINREGTGVLLVEQNAAAALALAERGYVMENGTIALADTAANLRGNARVVQSYLGG